MDENTRLYYDVIISQIDLARERLTDKQYKELLENLDEEVGTRFAVEGDKIVEDEKEG